MSGSFSEEGIGMDKKNYSSVPSRNKVLDPKRENGRARWNKKNEFSNKVTNENHVPKQQANATKFSEKKPIKRESFNRREREGETNDLFSTNTVYHGGHKKQNLNHLLNFSFAPREGTIQEGYRAKVSKTRSNNNWSRGTVKFNKEHFLQANCQFIVKSEGDYILHTADPDKLVDWACIEYVRISMHEVPCCPICLYPPVAGKLTRCGHIYCWPCILHYLALREDKSWMKCPICIEAVHEKDLKSVHTILTRSYKVDEDITMNLMKKERGATNVMKVSEWLDKKEQLFSIEDDIDVFYCKLLTASPQTLLNYLLDDEKALEKELRDSYGDELEASFINYALEQIKEKRAVLSFMNQLDGIEKDEIDVVKEVKVENALPLDELKKSKITIHYESAFDDISTIVSPDELNDIDSNEISQNEMLSASSPSSNDEMVSASSPSSNDEMLSARSPSSNDEMLSASSPSSNDEVTSSDYNLSSPEEMNNKSHIDYAETIDLDVSRLEEMDKNSNSNVKFTPKISPFFHFYQANDGQHVYLNPLNSKCLLKEYGSWENCPEILSAKILEFEYFTMNEEIRKRWKYLAHLPISCEFIVLELDLESIISRETMNMFADQISKRQRIRQKKVQEQNRFDCYSQERERKQWGLSSYAEARFNNSQNLPDTSISEIHKTNDATTNVLSPGNNGDDSPDSHEVSDQSSKSFAQMLRDGKSIKSNTKARCVGSVSDGIHAGIYAGEATAMDDENKDYVPPPQYQNSFGDAFQEALNNLNIDKGNSKKKKNKREKTILFSTHMARNCNL